MHAQYTQYVNNTKSYNTVARITTLHQIDNASQSIDLQSSQVQTLWMQVTEKNTAA